MAETDNLRLPYLMAAQAQKHVTHNEALRSLDAVVQLAVEDRDLTDPPLTPADGARYLIATPATGDWTGHDGEIAAYQDGAWMFHAPQEGWIAWVSDEDAALVYDGTAWVALSSGGGGGGVNPTPLVGVNATADTTNRLSVSSPASLLNHEGAGHQLKLNKAAAIDTASLLYQTNFSGRAELGLTGDDDFHFKVSGDGASWNEAIVIDKATGAVAFPNTSLGGGGGSAHAQAARVFDTTAQSIPNNVLTLITFNTEDYDIGGFFNAGTPTRLTIPAGVSRILCFAGIAMSTGVTSSFYSELRFRLRDSGGTIKTEVAAAQQNMAPVKTSGPIAVVPGDYIELLFYQASGSTRTAQTAGFTFLALEVLA